MTDITYVGTRQSWLYLAVVLDLFFRRIVGWAMGEQIDRHLVLSALDMGLKSRQPPHGLMQHSDRASQYANSAYQQALVARGIQCRMSRKGNCWANAVAESFFSSLKRELVHEAHSATAGAGLNGSLRVIEVSTIASGGARFWAI